MSFEIVRNSLIDRKNRALGRALEEYTSQCVREDSKRKNRANPANWVRVATPQNGVVERSFEVWISDDEEDGDGDDDQTHASRIIDGEEYAGNTVKRRKLDVDVDVDVDGNGGLSIPAKDEFKTITHGLETTPRVYTSNPDYPAGKYSELSAKVDTQRKWSTIKQSYYVFCQLLNLCVLRGDWKTAYKLFAVIIRTHEADVRTCWPLGLEILKRLNEETTMSQLEVLPGDAAKYAALSRNARLEEIFYSEQRCGVPFTAVRDAIAEDNHSRPWRNRVFRFLQYMVDYHKIYAQVISLPTKYPFQRYPAGQPADQDGCALITYADNSYMAYRSGNQKMVPMYSYALLWELLLSGQLKRLRELEDAMLVRDPYQGDAMVNYIVAMTGYMECVESAGRPQTTKEELRERVRSVRRQFKALRRFPGFEYDLKAIERGLKLLKKK